MAIPGEVPSVLRPLTGATPQALRQTGGAAAGPRTAPAGAGAAGGGGTDRVEVSEYARLLGRAQAQVRLTPDARARLVAELRARVDAGTYTVNARRVAERLLPAPEAWT